MVRRGGRKFSRGAKFLLRARRFASRRARWGWIPVCTGMTNEVDSPPPPLAGGVGGGLFSFPTSRKSALSCGMAHRVSRTPRWPGNRHIRTGGKAPARKVTPENAGRRPWKRRLSCGCAAWRAEIAIHISGVLRQPAAGRHPLLRHPSEGWDHCEGHGTLPREMPACPKGQFILRGRPAGQPKGWHDDGA